MPDRVLRRPPSGSPRRASPVEPGLRRWSSALGGRLACGQRFDGVFPHRAQLELSELAATYCHGTHRQGSVLPIAGSEGHSGPRSAVGDGRAHVVLLRSGCAAGRQPGRERALCLHSGVTRMLGAFPGDRRKFLFRRAASMVLPPGSRPQCRVPHAVNRGIPAIGWLCKMTAAATIGASSGLAAGRRTVCRLAMRSSGMGRLATVAVAAGHDSASAREAPVHFGSNFIWGASQAWL
jgi:hypothetical protein